jgi:hypothetical protein
MTQTHSTKIESVNTMLSTIGEAPVSELGTDASTEVSMAEQILGEVDRSVQARGWQFNTEIAVEFGPNTDDEIVLGSDIVRVTKPRNTYTLSRFTLRGHKLYDLKNHTFEFDDAVTLDAVHLIDFEDTPEVFRYYVTIRSTRIFQDRVQGDAAQHRYNAIDEGQALRDLQAQEGVVAEYNVLENPDVSRVLHRAYPRLPGI